jgi:hypothetical protein
MLNKGMSKVVLFLWVDVGVIWVKVKISNAKNRFLHFSWYNLY